jgi:hypothetical protein
MNVTLDVSLCDCDNFAMVKVGLDVRIVSTLTALLSTTSYNTPNLYTDTPLFHTDGSLHSSSLRVGFTVLLVRDMLQSFLFYESMTSGHKPSHPTWEQLSLRNIKAYRTSFSSN